MKAVCISLSSPPYFISDDMGLTDHQAFSELFKVTCMKCFGRNLEQPLSEPESRHLSNEIEEKTGLVVGWKSLKNYSTAVLEKPLGKPANPSTATLDTLARYVMDAPATTEILRKKEEAHFGFWFRYLSQFPGSETVVKKQPINWLKRLVLLAISALLSIWIIYYFSQKNSEAFSDNFQNLEESSMRSNDWFLLSEDSVFWKKRVEKQGQLTLFTLKGDSWRTATQAPKIPNLLTRKIPDDCFSTEVHFAGFIPEKNWQQAGILLLEDTAYLGKSLRLSLGFNNFFGGYKMPDEVLVQAVAGYGKNYQNVEEIKHQTLFSLSTDADRQIAANNLRHSALRIEKRGRHFRFLFAASQLENFSFRELSVYDFDMKPKFVGIFALKGFVDSAAVMPVAVKFFRLEGLKCE